MRTRNTIGLALAALVTAAVATVWLAPAAVAAGRQAGSQSQQTEKPKVEKQIVTVHKHEGGEPVVVTVEKQGDQGTKVVTHAYQGEPMIAAMAGGGPRLGVRIRNLTKEDLAKFKLSTPTGVVVEEVTKESAAEKAGVKTGDVVVQFDGENVRSAMQLTRLVRETVAGRTVKMGVVRDGKRMDVDVAPVEVEAENTFDVFIDKDALHANIEKELKGVDEKMLQFHVQSDVPGLGQPMPPGAFRWKQPMPMPIPDGGALQYFGEGGTGNFYFSTGRPRLGVMVQELTPELAAYFGVKDGLLVNSVEADTPAAKAGIKAGDVIGSVNGKAVASHAEFVKELADKEGEVTVGLTRDKKPLSLKATLEPKKTPARRAPVVGRPA